MTERRTDREPGAVLLIVEDDPRIANVLAKGLRKQGFDSEWVTTGAEAITRTEVGGLGLLLLDLGLPDIDGLEVLRTFHDRGIAPPVIVITARSDPSDRAAALSLGARAYFTKPFKWAEVWDAVRLCGVTPDRA